MEIKSAKYLTSVVNAKDILSDGTDYAFVGRSNVGKSSFINSLINQKLARTSSEPGRTRMINYFLINNCFRFVDLPGYGYHKAGKQNEKMWESLIEDYLQNSNTLKRVFMLVDIRHNPTALDIQMLTYLSYTGIPFTVIATKADKIAKSKIPVYLSNIAKVLKITSNNVIAYSSETKLNKDRILSLFE